MALPGVLSAITPGLGALAGGVISAGASLLGGHLDRKAARDAAQHGIQWRVQDALAAGVHPLFALGYNAPFVPGPGASIADAGEKIGNAVTAASQPDQRELMRAQLEQMKASAANDFSQSQYWDSVTAKTVQEMRNNAPAPPLNVSQFIDDESGAIVRSLDPMLHSSRVIERPIERAGLDNPDRAQSGWTAFEFGDGPIVLPYTPPGQGLMESLEGLDIKYLPAVLAENSRRYGPAGRARMLKLFSEWGIDVDLKTWKKQGPKSPAGSRSRPWENFIGQ